MYSLCYQSSDNQNERITFYQSLHYQLLKAGSIYSARWVAVSYRNVKTSWQSYSPLWEYFRQKGANNSRSTAERAKH